MVLESINYVYEVVYFKRKDELYNTYVQKTSKLSGNYIGEAVYSVGCKDKKELAVEDVLHLNYQR